MDCDTTYAIKYETPQAALDADRIAPTFRDPTSQHQFLHSEEEANHSENDDEGPKPKKRIRGSRSSHTHRKKSDPDDAPDPVARPSQEQLGQLHTHIDAIISDGPDALISAKREAAKIAKRFKIDFEAKWLLLTPYLRKLTESSHRSTRLRARHAITWRPRYLAALAVTGSKIVAARAAQVTYKGVVDTHMTADPDFAAQVEASKEYCKELLKSRMMQRALEGDCEPVLYMGVPVAWVRKFDSRLQIEMARALMPAEFKTPGNHVTLNDNRGALMVMDAPAFAALREQRRLALTGAGRPALPAPTPTTDEVVTHVM